MLIRITGLAEVTHNDGAPVVDESILEELNGAVSEDLSADYLDFDLADLGINSGAVKLTHIPGVGFRVVTEYTSPVELEASQLTKLMEDTLGHWSDGIGEGCFDALAERLGVCIDLSPLDGADHLRVEQIDDGKKVAKPKTGLCKAAREGNVEEVRKQLDAGVDPEIRLQRYTALHLAVLYGHADAALELISRGADVTALDPQGSDALMLTALSRTITDEDAARVARTLLERGVSVYGPEGPHANPDYGQYTPLYMAHNRKKVKLAVVLEEFGAVK